MPNEGENGYVDDGKVDYQRKQSSDVVKIAEAKSIKANDNLRKMMTEGVLPLFKWVNLFVVIIIILAMFSDFYLFINDKGDFKNRLINSQVIMALISAVTIQLGAIIFTMVAYLFPKNK